jgi:hypothetical protein
MAVPGQLGDDPDGHPVPWVGAGVAVLHEHVTPLEEPLQPAEELAERAVCLPVKATIGPDFVMRASRRNVVSS